MGQEYGFLVDLAKYTFSEDQPTWVQAFPLGKWTHPKYGEINVTPDKVARMAANIKSNVRGQELDIDYDHKMHSGEASGWVKDAQTRTDGLWLAVQWTKDAYTKIKDGAYKYFSPEYADEWTNPVDNKVYQDVIFGGGITNRPFLKGILPLNLSEAFDNVGINTGGKLDPKKIRELLKLSEDATDEEVTAKLNELVTPKPDDLGKSIRAILKLSDTATEADITTKLNELTKPEPSGDPTVQVLAESNPVIKQMLDEMTALKAANRLSEVNLALTELEADNSDFALAPNILSEVRTLALDAPKAVGDKLINLLADVRKNGIVDLRAHGGKSPKRNDDSGDSATKRFNDAIAQSVKDNKLSYAEAASAIAANDPELFREYRNESYLREGAK